MRFDPHGSKDLRNLTEVISGGSEIEWHKIPQDLRRCIYGKIILHDQEPLTCSDLSNTYKMKIHEIEKSYEYEKILESLNTPEMISCELKGSIQHILCHSEINSPDIETLKRDCLMIECYYWYHAMIARDWFRHWQHHPDLSIRDRSHHAYRFIMYAQGLDGSRTYRNHFIDQMKIYSDRMLYDWSRKNNITSDYSAKISIEDANRSAIHIVLETIFDTSKVHLTEKIFKPMVMSQPFFVLSGPGSLKYLRDYGFRTFGEFWDESYDLVGDSQKRMECIRIEIKKLMDMPLTEFSDLYKSMLPIIEHNRNHFFSDEFQTYCINEMRDNFSKALETQSQNLLVHPGGAWFKIVSNLIERGFVIPSRWQSVLHQGFKSKKFFVPVNQILKTYPNLSRFQD